MKQRYRYFWVIAGLFFCSLTLQAQDTAYPKNGDGITVFLKRHNRSGEAYRKEFIELNKNKLGKGNELRLGVRYTLPQIGRAHV